MVRGKQGKSKKVHVHHILIAQSGCLRGVPHQKSRAAGAAKFSKNVQSQPGLAHQRGVRKHSKLQTTLWLVREPGGLKPY